MTRCWTREITVNAARSWRHGFGGMLGGWLAVGAAGCSPQPGVPSCDGGAGCDTGSTQRSCDTSPVTYEPAAPPGHVVAMSAADAHTCVVFDDGSARCWGLDDYGQIGDSSLAGGRYPTQVKALPKVQKVVTGGSHTCALSLDGCAWCWGGNDDGQLGIGGDEGSWVPALVQSPADVFVTNVVDISAHWSTSAALLNTGDVWTWGDRISHLARTPEAWILGSAYKSISVGAQFACGVRLDGGVDCWGANAYGQLGTGDKLDRTEPTNVMGLSDVTGVAVGLRSVCAVLQSGSLYCWGSNKRGTVGDGTTTDRLTPTQVALSEVTGVSLYFTHACARVASGRVYCWGENALSEVGNGTKENPVTSPWQVASIMDAREVVVGSYFSCALRGDHDVFCWGYNQNFELGDGTAKNSPTPVQVVWDAPAQ